MFDNNPLLKEAALSLSLAIDQAEAARAELDASGGLRGEEFQRVLRRFAEAVENRRLAQAEFQRLIDEHLASLEREHQKRLQDRFGDIYPSEPNA